MTFVGIGLALGNWAVLAVLTLAPTAGLVVRIHFEERALLDGLGEPYRRFAASPRGCSLACGDPSRDDARRQTAV